MIQTYVFAKIFVWVQYFDNLSLSCIHVYFIVALLIAFCSFSSYSRVNTITKKDKHTLRHPYRTRSKTKIMDEIEEVQEKIKADMKPMKDQMTSMIKYETNDGEQCGHSCHHQRRC